MLSIKHNTRTDSSDNNHRSSSEPVFGKSSMKVLINLKVNEWTIISCRMCGDSINMRRVYVRNRSSEKSEAILMARGQTLTEWAGRAPRGKWYRDTRAPHAAPLDADRVRAPIQHRIPNIYQYALNVIIVIPKQITLPCGNTSKQNIESYKVSEIKL